MSIDGIVFKSPIPGTSSKSTSKVEGTTVVNGQDTLLIADMSSRELLAGILIELKILNLRQQEVFKEAVSERDIK